MCRVATQALTGLFSIRILVRYTAPDTLTLEGLPRSVPSSVGHILKIDHIKHDRVPVLRALGLFASADRRVECRFKVYRESC